jgi:hypothetical protein
MAGIGILSDAGFKGFMCIFCGEIIPPTDTTMLTIVIQGGNDSKPEFRAHRGCMATAMPRLVQLAQRRKIRDWPDWDILPANLHNDMPR